ncbi:unnamed protein product, partial [Rotaria sp. Silwood2]
MKRKNISEKSNNFHENDAGVSSGNPKSRQPAEIRGRVTGLSENQITNISRNHKTFSGISTDENEEPQPAKRRRVSIVYKYVKRISNSEYECNIIRCTVDSNANIKRHLANVHGLDDVKPKSLSLTTNIQMDPFRKSKLDEAAIRCIIVDRRPFGDFRKHSMRDFLAAIVPCCSGPHERAVQRKIKKLYANKLLEHREKLKNA